VITAALDNLVRAFDRNSGARKWDSGVTYRPMSSPLVVGTSVIVSGAARELPSFDSRTGKPVERLTLSAGLAVPLAAAVDAGVPVIAAIPGDVSVGWRLELLEPMFGVRAAPLTVLPGLPVPLQPAPLPGPPK
jgi:hypothetical protein